jgi:phage FluMu protein Com
MTAAVILFAEAKQAAHPHMTGAARCQACGKEWEAVAPVGTHELECPSCKATKGYMVNAVLRGNERFVCNCGCDVFRISPIHGPYCVNCAVPAEGWF